MSLLVRTYIEHDEEIEKLKGSLNKPLEITELEKRKAESLNSNEGNKNKKQKSSLIIDNSIFNQGNLIEDNKNKNSQPEKNLKGDINESEVSNGVEPKNKLRINFILN